MKTEASKNRLNIAEKLVLNVPAMDIQRKLTKTADKVPIFDSGRVQSQIQGGGTKWSALQVGDLDNEY
jgi:hypothetical protein